MNGLEIRFAVRSLRGILGKEFRHRGSGYDGGLAGHKLGVCLLNLKCWNVCSSMGDVFKKYCDTTIIILKLC